MPQRIARAIRLLREHALCASAARRLTSRARRALSASSLSVTISRRSPQISAAVQFQNSCACRKPAG